MTTQKEEKTAAELEAMIRAILSQLAATRTHDVKIVKGTHPTWLTNWCPIFDRPIPPLAAEFASLEEQIAELQGRYVLVE